MIFQKFRIIHVKFLDNVSTCSSENFCRKEILTHQVVIAQLHLRVEDATDVTISQCLEKYDFTQDLLWVDVDLTDLCNLCGHIFHFYLVIHFYLDVHRLIICHVVV